jgi:hypothetical protein
MARLDRTANLVVHTRLSGLTLPRVDEATASLRPPTHSGRTGAVAAARVTAHRQALAPWEVAVVLAVAVVEGSTDRRVADHTALRDVANSGLSAERETPPFGAAF